MDRNFQLLSSAMDSFPESTCEDEGNLLAEANSVLDDLKLLSALLDKRLDCISLIVITSFFHILKCLFSLVHNYQVFLSFCF